jgi:hypothetical protein
MAGAATPKIRGRACAFSTENPKAENQPLSKNANPLDVRPARETSRNVSALQTSACQVSSSHRSEGSKPFHRNDPATSASESARSPCHGSLSGPASWAPGALIERFASVRWAWVAAV